MKTKSILIILITLIIITFSIYYFKLSQQNIQPGTDEPATNLPRVITVLNSGGSTPECPEGTEFVKSLSFGIEGGLLCRLLLEGDEFVDYALTNIQKGMFMFEVKRFLGEPDIISKENLGEGLSECWTYNEGEGYMVCFDNSQPYGIVSYSSGLGLG